MLNDSILSLITFVPTAGAIVVALLPRRGKLIQWFTLLVTLLTFALTLHLPAHYQYGQGGFQFEENHAWIPSPKIGYHLGIDGISMWLIVLVGFLGPLAVLASWKAIATLTKEFYFLFLIQQTAMLGVFVSLDMFLYYGFWELSLVPMAILIAMFGRNRGPQAAIKFFLFTFIPSALLLVGLLWLYAKTGTFDFVETQQYLSQNSLLLAPQALWWVSLAFLAAFAVKVPVFPLHGWLSDVFSEAPTAMAMVVAGKLGLYSIIRFNLGLFPEQSRQIAPLMIALAVIGILYGALIALIQQDLKRFISFSTVGHLSFCTLGIFCFTVVGLNGALYQILNHELSGAAILILFGILYERYGTYDMALYGGMASNLPRMATLYVITTLSLIGLPILNGFVGEFLILSSSFGVHPYWSTAATLGVILSAAYMLTMIQKLFYGKQSQLVVNKPVPDIVFREGFALIPAAVLMLVMGVASPYWIHAINGAVSGLADTVTQHIAHTTMTVIPNVAEKR
ncbi:NADH-quinone oxidoreductase subunit M [Alloacidobacterium sp.]|uniref:complex I subunit 4 family protein n=1 Tax=Alloacidobacterium sp. TaxID=2951999 RepID=UPI002D75A617|nr:NADH-quinone oxidoreductase subunit M [Alloacidobacterium sp.]HYK37332.1 NADH-quinone oxidoreductase subunit M [Alloacidobacterium sp.]